LPDASKLERGLVEYLDGQIDKGNGKLMDAEQTDLFNQWIHGWLTAGGGSPWASVGALLILLTLVGLVAGFFRLVVHGFQQQQPMAPNLARLVEQQEPADSLMEQRNQGMYQVQNLWEIGRQVARQVFEAAGVAAKAGDPLPAVAVKGSRWEQHKIRRQVTFLWKLAFGAKPLPVGPSQWPGMLRQLDQLRRALADGSVRLG
jgi:hypothetical protein